MKKVVYTFCLLLFVIFSLPALAGIVQINGIIRNINTYQRIPGVNIFIKNSNIGTVSDISGEFLIELKDPDAGMIIVFQHIAYDICEIKFDSLQSMKTIYLQPRVIPLQIISVEAERDKSRNILLDLPQSISVVKADKFENQGFLDAGDYLTTDYSIQVEEDYSGEKSIGMRGGNPDDVLILYDGIKINSPLDNTFNLALIDLQDIDRLEIIRGSNTAIYGSGGTAGVINIVPKIERDYNIRFQQKFGTYNTGIWGLHLYKDLNNVHAAYSYRKGASEREYAASLPDNYLLVNKSAHHTASLNYKSQNKILGGTFIHSNLLYENPLEETDNNHQLFSVHYHGNIHRVQDISISASKQNLEEKYNQIYTLGQGIEFLERDIFLEKNIKDKSYYFTINKMWSFKKSEIFMAYQLEDSKLDFKEESYDQLDEDIIQNIENMNRKHHGFLAIGKILSEVDSLSNKSVDIDISIRNDRINEERTRHDVTETDNWNKTTIKFSSNFNGSKNNIVYHGFINYGKNIKFPTMIQKMSASFRNIFPEEQINLDQKIEPEISKGYDIGFELTGRIPQHIQSKIYGWHVAGYIFKTDYTNKLRASYTPGFPLVFYDNVIVADINGFETNSKLFFFNKKITLGFGYSHYSISDKSAFPFKYENKVILDLNFDHKGYHCGINLFSEGEQVGRVRDFTGEFEEIYLPGHTNLDFHFEKHLEIRKIKFFTNFTIRNLLNKSIDLSGLAIRDRRIYLTFGAQI